MRKLILLFVFITFVSCNSNKLEGVYKYEKVASEESIFSIGAGIGCSMIGKFEFKDGLCYMNFLGKEIHSDYSIDNGIIRLGESLNGNTAAEIRIVDNNTIEYLNCVFKKEENSKELKQKLK